jgi:hypothetical protein
MSDSGRRVRSDRGGRKGRDVDAGAGADVREHAVGDQQVDRVQVEVLGQVLVLVECCAEPVVKR